MNTAQFLTSAWTWSPALLIICAMSLAGYLAACGVTKRLGYFLAALGVGLLTLCSPLNALADGYLFSAHMMQHILLLLVVPALLLASLPPEFDLSKPVRKLANPLTSWLFGVGAMWLWHAP